MAFDEQLLVQALDSDQLAVRVYGWDEPTVSLGYFQKDLGSIDGRFERLPQVRRLSGGGAILHHHEITYSIALPKSHWVANNPSELYGLAHAAIIGELLKSGIHANRRGDVEHPIDDPFLCFSRQDPNDIVMGETKIVGSAQRRRRGAVLQHGSILLKSSEIVPELPGIADLDPSARFITLDRKSIGRAIASSVATDIEDSELRDDEVAAIVPLLPAYRLRVE